MTDPTTDTAMRDLVVENELLTNEVRRLRSRIAALEEELAVAPPAPQANEALGDLRYLLGRLFLFDVVRGASGPRFRYRLFGSAIAAYRGYDLTGRFVDESRLSRTQTSVNVTSRVGVKRSRARFTPRSRSTTATLSCRHLRTGSSRSG